MDISDEFTELDRRADGELGRSARDPADPVDYREPELVCEDVDQVARGDERPLDDVPSRGNR